jgi:hypothetical protein
MDYPITMHYEFHYRTNFQNHEPEVIFCTVYVFLVYLESICKDYTNPFRYVQII